MVLKQCVVCGKDFNARGSSKTCSKKCSVIHRKQYRKQYCQDNAEYFKEYNKQYRQDNAEYFKQYNKQYYQDNAERIKEHNKQYRQDNAERIKEYNKQYRQDNAERIKEYNKQYRQDNAERIKEYNKQYYQDNAEYFKEYNKQYHQDKLNYYYNELSNMMNIEEDRIKKILPIWFVQRELECIENGSYFLDFICSVHDRASGKCELTGKQSSNLVVHHLNGYNWYIEGRMDINNAVVIDKEVHDAFHDKYGRGNNTKKQWEEFAEDYNKGVTTLDDFR